MTLVTAPQQLSTLYYVDDSDDEIYLSRLLFQRQKIALKVVHFAEFTKFRQHIVSLPEDELINTLMVVDLNLTLCKGTEVIEWLRSQPCGKQLMVGICSGSDDPADHELAIAAGADFFIPKPLNAQSLATLSKALDGVSVETDADGRLLLMSSRQESSA